MPFVAPKAGLMTRRRTAALDVTESSSRLTISNGERTVQFNKSAGAIHTIALNGKVIMEKGPVLNIWRAATDNDGIRLWTHQTHKPLNKWQAELLASFDAIAETGRQVSLHVNSLAAALAQTQAYIASRYSNSANFGTAPVSTYNSYSCYSQRFSTEEQDLKRILEGE